MNYATRLLAVLSACLVTGCCLAAGAQAEGNWLVNGSNLAKGLDPTVNWKQEGVAAFLLPGLNLELVFNKLEVINANLTSEGKGTAKFELSEGKVNTISPLEPVTSCTVGNLVFETSSNLFLHGGKTYNALTLSTVTTYGGAECPLTGKNVVSGTVVLEGSEVSLEKGIVEHLMKVASAALFPELKLKFGAQALVFDGSWILSLAGSHSGLTWAGIG